MIYLGTAVQPRQNPVTCISQVMETKAKWIPGAWIIQISLCTWLCWGKFVSIINQEQIATFLMPCSKIQPSSFFGGGMKKFRRSQLPKVTQRQLQVLQSHPFSTTFRHLRARFTRFLGSDTLSSLFHYKANEVMILLKENTFSFLPLKCKTKNQNQRQNWSIPVSPRDHCDIFANDFFFFLTCHLLPSLISTLTLEIWHCFLEDVVRIRIKICILWCREREWNLDFGECCSLYLFTHRPIPTYRQN